jgi:MerR family transcriptional regulator, thiopeptide resistance regulator
MANSNGADEKLTAAACAARTGLTVRALRVYERSGLLKPPRAPSGWRQYGPRELARLNTICVLKSAGLTLAQIRAALRHSDPSLREVLQAQVENWQRKREDAELGRRTAEAALKQLESHHALDVDRLCELIRNAQVKTSPPPLGDFMRRILALPRKARLAWAKRHNEEINPQSAQQFQEAVRTRIDPALQELMDAGTAPCSAEAQKLIAEHLDLMCRYAVRETALEWLNGAGAASGSFSEHTSATPRDAIARHVLPKLKQRPTEGSDLIASQWTSNPFLVGFFAQAELQSAQCRAIDMMLLEAGEQVPAVLVSNFRALCRTHGLGDPVVYARWAAIFRPPPPDMTEEEDRRIWVFIADSTAATNSAGPC